MWVAYLQSLGYDLDSALWLNMDETAVKYHYVQKSGYKVRPTKEEVKQQMVEKASLRDTRSHCTLAGCLASQAEVQAHLPQIFFPNLLGRVRKWKKAKAALHKKGNVQIDLDSNGWMTGECMLRYVTAIAKIIKDMKFQKVVFVMDCHSAHLPLAVLKKLRKLKWKVLLIPSKMTWLLQPLDAHMYAGLKEKLYIANITDRMESETGIVDFATWSKSVFSTVDKAFANVTGKAMFHKCGCQLPMRAVHHKLEPYIPSDALGPVRKLSIVELSSYIGKRSDAMYPFLFYDNIPESMKHNHVALRAPTSRMSSKRSLSALLA